MICRFIDVSDNLEAMFMFPTTKAFNHSSSWLSSFYLFVIMRHGIIDSKLQREEETHKVWDNC